MDSRILDPSQESALWCNKKNATPKIHVCELISVCSVVTRLPLQYMILRKQNLQLLMLRSKDPNVFGINHFMDWSKQNYQSTILQCANFLQFHFDYLNWKQLYRWSGSDFYILLLSLKSVCVWIPVHFSSSMYCNNRIMENKWCSDEKNIRVTLSMVIHIW